MVIYVLPTEEHLPPRAVLLEDEQADGGPLVTWSHDSGTWMLGELPVPPELGEAITAHARALGVEW